MAEVDRAAQYKDIGGDNLVIQGQHIIGLNAAIVAGALDASCAGFDVQFAQINNFVVAAGIPGDFFQHPLGVASGFRAAVDD